MNKIMKKVIKFKIKVILDCYGSFIVYEPYTKLSLGE